MRDFILFYINGKRRQVSDSRAFLLLSDYLRQHLGLTGAKVVCGEGACGACSVLIGAAAHQGGDNADLRYHSVNACLYRVFQLDRRHVITVEGLNGADNALSPVQKAVAENHGAQCGYCTPGMVISLTALGLNAKTDPARVSGESVRDALSGNLCRCTGYLPLYEAGLSLADLDVDDLSASYPPDVMREDFERNAASSIRIGSKTAARSLFVASTLTDALSYLGDCPQATIIAGGTGVPPVADTAGSGDGAAPLLSIGAIAELSRIEKRDDALFAGATATWAQLRPVAETLFPELARLLERFGSPQIRHQGTIGGSIAQAEGNSDWLPLLLVQNAVVHLAFARNGERALPFAAFLEEKIAPGELVTGVTIPLPLPGERLRLYKVARRQAFDRSVFCAAVRMTIAPEGHITDCRIACGGVGPQPVRLTQTERFLTGARYEENILRQAGSIAGAELAPVADAYAVAEYRRQLAARLLTRFYHDAEPAPAEVSAIG